MAVNPLGLWSTTAASNTTLDSISTAESVMTVAAVNNAFRSLMAGVKEILDAISGAKTTAGTADAQTLTTGYSLSAYAAGQLYGFKAGVALTNTGPATLSVDSIGAKSLKRVDGSALVAGDITAGGIYLAAYQATTDTIHLLTPTPVSTSSFQTVDATLTALAAVVTAADKLIYATGVDTFSTTDFTAAGRALVDDASAAAQRTTLGVGTADSPQFTAVELGNASDTTLARAAAGQMSVEGSVVGVFGTEDTTPDGTADFVATYDTSASGPKKVKPTNFSRAGGLQLLTSGTVAAAAVLDIVLTSYTAYRGLVFVLSSFVPATDNTGLIMRVSTNGGGAYDAGVADYKYRLTSFDDTPTEHSASTATAHWVLCTDSIGSGAAEGIDVIVEMLNQTATTSKPKAQWRFSGYTFDDHGYWGSGSGVRNTAQDTDAVRFAFASGNITSGNYAVYGYA